MKVNKTEAKDIFDNYPEFVRLQAQKLNKIFMLDTGEGRNFIDPITGWDVEDLSGWLIAPDQRTQFLKDRDNDKVYDTFGQEYVFVEWMKNERGEIGIIFKKYPDDDLEEDTKN